MTETPDTEQRARIVPEGRDALDDLTVGELGTIGRRLGYDPYAAVNDPTTGLRWEALGHIAHAWAKRTDPRAKLDDYLAMTGGEVAQLLGIVDDDDQADDDDEDTAEANPTDCAGGSPSPAPGDSIPTP